MASSNTQQSVVDYRLAYRLSRRHDIDFLKSIVSGADMEQVLLSKDIKRWLDKNQCHALDIIGKLHVLLELEKQDNKRHFGFQFRGQAMAFQIVYIDQSAWDKRIYRERRTGENNRKVQRMLHMYLFEEIHASKAQRLQIVKEMLFDHAPSDEYS